MRCLSLLLVLMAVPVVAQDAERGADVFATYCATCHGPEGRGDGPMVSVLEILPADLRGLANRAGGAFPVADVARKIDGRDPLLSHGGPMPVYGFFFRGDDVAIPSESGQPILTTQPLADVLAFLETLQD